MLALSSIQSKCIKGENWESKQLELRLSENEEQTFFVCVAENKAVCLFC